jgi:hypothetical protein
MTVRLIVITFGVLSLANAYSYARLYSLNHSSLASVDPKKTTRMPASIQPSTAKIQAPELKTRVSFDLNCKLNKKMAGLKVRGNWTQLKGRVCGGDKLKLIEITNLNNGFTASVFSSGSQQYQTDLIQLEQGDNKIRVRITPVKGVAEEQTVIVSSLPI